MKADTGFTYCRSGCTTGGHRSWGECARAARLQVPKQESQFHDSAYTPKAWDAELDLYRKARAEGIQPRSTKKPDIEAAMEVSRATGKRFDATTNTFAE